MKSKLLITILKVTISVAAICYVAASVDFLLIKEAIVSANPGLMVLALFLFAFSQVAAAYRLNCLFIKVPVFLSHIKNIKLYWLGLFYNLFLPGGVGGDAFKVYLIGKHMKAPVRKVIGAILSDRVSGLAVIVIFILLLIPFIDYGIPFKEWAWALIPLVPVAFLAFLYIFNRSLVTTFIPVMIWSFVVQLIQMGAAIMLLFSLGVVNDGVHENFLFLFFLSAIMGSIPITLGGIGARELTFLFGSQYLGINQTHAVALSILFYAASAISSLPGIIYAINPLTILKPTTEANEE